MWPNHTGTVPYTFSMPSTREKPHREQPRVNLGGQGPIKVLKGLLSTRPDP